MSQSTKFKSYGDWLFEDDQTSIIYEKKYINVDLNELMLNEGWTDTLMDLGQLGLSVIGALPPLEATGIAEAADIANFGIYLGRQMWLSALFSGISIIPIIGDAIGKSSQLISWISRVGAGEGAMATLVRWVASNVRSIYPALQRLSTFMGSWGKYIKRLFEVVAHVVSREDENEETSSSSSNSSNSSSEEEINRRNANTMMTMQAAGLMEQGSTSGDANNPNYLNSIPEYIRPIATTILASDTLKDFFKNPNVVQGLTSAVDQASTLINNAMNLVNGSANAVRTGGGAAAAPAATDSGTGSGRSAARTAITESVYYTDTRFKKLAGIK